MGPAEWVGADATMHVYVTGLVEAVFAAQSQDCRAEGEGYTRRDEIGQLGDIPCYVSGASDTRNDDSCLLYYKLSTNFLYVQSILKHYHVRT